MEKEVEKMKHVFIMQETKKHHDFEKDIREVMKGYDVQIVYTHSVRESRKYVQSIQEPARFYAVGGDGTLKDFVEALVYTYHELVVIPLGTGNDFCRMLTHEKNPKLLLEKSLSCQSQKIDCIQLNESYYLNATCFGLDSIIANHVHDTLSIPLIPQSKSYIVSILQHVFHYKCDRVKIMSEGKCLFDDNMILCTLNNAQYYGGGFPIIPHAKIDDGLMDICVVDSLSKLKIPYMVYLLLRRDLYKRKEVHYFQVKEATVYYPKSCNVDGDERKEDVYHFQICPSSLNMVIYE